VRLRGKVSRVEGIDEGMISAYLRPYPIAAQDFTWSAMNELQNTDANKPLDAVVEKPQAPPSWRELLDNPWLMVLGLFFVTAALGLPFLWMSRGFSTFWKILLTIAVLLWTALVFWVFYLIMAWCWSQLEPVFWPGAS
jgi:hypothetical protein